MQFKALLFFSLKKDVMQTFQEDDNVDITSYSTLETCEESTDDQTDFDDVNDFYCVNESGTSGDCRLIFSLIFFNTQVFYYYY